MAVVTESLDGNRTAGAVAPPPGWRRRLPWLVGAVSAGAMLGRAVQTAASIRQVDLGVYRMGASDLFSGRLYTAMLPGAHLPFTYPPLAALLFVPLVGLSDRAAQVTWAVVSAALLVGFLAVSLRAVRPRWSRSQVVCWALVLSYPAMVLDPVGLSFTFGQVNVLLALMVLADLTGRWHLGRWEIPRGLLTGLAAACKLTPAIFVPFLFFTRQTRAAWVGLATFVGGAAVMAAVVPSESWTYWTHDIFDAHRVGGVVFVSNQSLRSTIVRFNRQHAPEPVIVVLVVAVAVAGMAVAVWAHRSSSPLLGILVCAVTGLLVSPITWAHHLVWVVPVLLWLALADDRPAGGRLWAAAGAAWFWWGAIWRVPHGSGRELADTVAQLLLANSYTLVMLAFVAGIAAMLTVRRVRGAGVTRGWTDPAGSDIPPVAVGDPSEVPR